MHGSMTATFFIIMWIPKSPCAMFGKFFNGIMFVLFQHVIVFDWKQTVILADDFYPGWPFIISVNSKLTFLCSLYNNVMTIILPP